MTNINLASIYAQTAFAAYADDLVAGSLGVNVVQYFEADMSVSQATQFDSTWNVLAQSTPTLNGFSAALLQNRTTGEKVLAIAGTDSASDVFTDILDIAIYGNVTNMPQYGSLNVFYQQLLFGGLLTSTEEIVVTGHSLGGFLAQAFTAQNSNVVSATYTYNAPGVGGALAQLLSFLGIPDAIASSKITNVRANDGWSFTAGLGTMLGTRQEVSIEPDLLQFGNHSILRLADSLAVQSALAVLDPSISLNTTGALLQAASNDSDRSLESLFDGVLRMLVGDITTGDREALYTNLQGLNTSLSEGGALHALAGSLRVNVASSALATEAKTEFSALVALDQLSSVVLRGSNTANQDLLNTTLGNVHGDLYALWQADQALTAEQRLAGLANISDQWLNDRTRMLLWVQQYNQRDVAYGSTLNAATIIPGLVGLPVPWQGNARFEDRASGIVLDINGVDNGQPRSLVVFGGNGNDSINGAAGKDRLYGGEGSDNMWGGAGDDYIEGGDDVDTLYGEAGNDTLIGGAGNDILTTGTGRDTLDGGAGFDVYNISTGATSTTIRDVDGSGSIQIERVDYSTYTLGNSEIREIAGSPGIYKDNEENRYLFNNGNLIVFVREGGRSLIIENFTAMPGSPLGINLQESEPIQLPATSRTFVGDREIRDYDDDEPGIQPHEDALGNRITLNNTDYIQDELNGSANADTIIGGSEGDILIGKGGDDIIYADQVVDIQTAIESGRSGAAPSGDLILSGENNNDFLSGGSGNDTLIGSSGGDLLSGGAGEDLIVAGQGNDLIFGDTHFAVTTYDWGFNWVYSRINGNHNFSGDGRQSDYAPEGGAADVIYAGGGYDVAMGGAGNDFISGDDGDDRLYGGAGDDTILGGEGNDIINGDGDWQGYVNPANAGRDFLDGGDGDDFIHGGGDSDVIYGGSGNDYITGDSESAFSGNDYLNGGDGDDKLYGGGMADTLLGGNGNDELVGDDVGSPEVGGNDYLDGGAGDDDIRGSVGNDTLIGGSGNDYLSGDDWEHENQWHGADYLDGGEGNDVLVGGGASDTLLGGKGDDELIGDLESEFDVEHGDDFLDGGEGNDILIGGGGDDVLLGGAGADLIFGDQGNLGLARAGSDFIDGGDGNDELWGQGGSDTIFGGAGNDLIYGNDASATYSSDDDDTLSGGEGNDVIIGGSGNDYLDGGAGLDILEGGAGDDVYVFNRSDMRVIDGFVDSIEDSGGRNRVIFNDVRSGEIYLTTGINGVPLLMCNDNTAGISLLSAFNGGQLIFQFADGIEIYGHQLIGQFFETAISTTTNTSNAYLVGGTRRDMLAGYGESNTLSGGRGDDALNGGIGRKTTYLFELGDGHDVIYDVAGRSVGGIQYANTIVFGEGITSTGLTLEYNGQAGTFKIYYNDNADSIRLQYFDPTNVVNGWHTIDEFKFESGSTLTWQELVQQQGIQIAGDNAFYGTNLNDRISGSSRNDLLNGLGGDDTYEINVDSGADEIIETTGFDRIRFGQGIDPSNVTIIRTSTVPRLSQSSGDSLAFVVGSGATQVLVTNYFDGSSDNQIEEVVFANGTVWNAAEIALRTINASGHADTFTGTSGNDVFEIDHWNDQIFDAGDGTDEVRSRVSYTLPDDVENLTLTGSLSIDGHGNALDNVIVGNSASNVLRGYAGHDVLIGGLGDDIYIMDDPMDYTDNHHRRDVIVEHAGEGNDTLLAISDGGRYVLGAHVENGIADAPNVSITGNDLDNQLIANASAYYGVELTGGNGNDVLIDFSRGALLRGGAGSDIYRPWSTMHDAVTVIKDTDRYSQQDSALDVLEFAPAISRQDLTFSRGSSGVANSSSYDLLITHIGGQRIVIKDFFANGDLNDRIELFRFSGGAVMTANEVAASLVVTGTSGPDTLTARSTSSDLLGGDGADVLIGGAGSDLLDGGSGADSMAGGANDDVYRIDHVGDTVHEQPDGGIDTIESRISYVLGENLENLTLIGDLAINGTGNSADNVLVGNNAVNVLSGGAGDDKLDGRGGADQMFGGTGSDIYVVDDVGDIVVENSDEGFDLVEAYVDYALTANVEYLTLLGTGNLSGVGNALNNVLTGNSGDNILDGGLGADSMRGGDGNDIYYVDHASDYVEDFVNQGIDEVRSTVSYTMYQDIEYMQIENLTLLGSNSINGTGNALDNVIIGNSGNNILTGNAGNDTLDGGSGGTDTLRGGLGDDTYIVNRSSGITITENSNQGIDTVLASVTHTLANNVENLVLTGTGNIGGTGNSLANIITGNSGNNAINGGGGADTLIGGLGDDTYTVDNVGDVVIELLDEGTDTVNSSVTFTLSAHVENLTLTGSSAINGTGNALNNVLTGNSGANVLTGGAGDDTYVIGTGDSVVELANEGIDTVQSSITYTLGNHVENLTLTGTSAINGTGNGLDNVLIGNSGSNILTGGAGNDTLDGGSAGTDQLRGGTGNDTYIVNRTSGITITENANEGIDLIQSSVTLASALGSNIELLFLTGTSAINGTGNALANLLRGNAANNTLSGGGGVDILEGGGGNDTLSNSGSNTLFNGGAGTDTLTGNGGNDLFIGGAGNDAIITGTGADIIAFNKGDGQDTVGVSTTKDNTVSIGQAVYADLLFQKSGNNLILKVGATDQITFTDYYASTSNRSVNKLQVVLEGTTEYAPGSGNAIRDNKIETFDFGGLVAAFDAARTANPSLTTWALSNALAAQYLAGSDTAAIGGDLAYRYGRFGNLSDISFTPAVGILGSSSFGTGMQALQPIGSLQDSTPRLS